MADVTGRIGNEDVELNNAATEATLKLLLQATLAAAKGSTEEVKKIAALAGRAGLDSQSIKRANDAIRDTTPQISKLGKAATAAGAALGSIKGEVDQLGQLLKKIAAGNAQASDLFGAMGMLPGPLGLVAKGFQQVASYQEGLFKSYQDLSKSGINFGGSLTGMRVAAAETHMTLEEFTGIMNTNSKLMAKLGGSAEEGARAFVNVSKTLVSGDIGDGLRALGYTTKDLNQGLADYLEMTGGRTREEMRDQRKLAQGAAQYLEQLDGLAALTGESREALAAKMKQDARNQAWEAYLLTLDEDAREKANAAYTEAMARGGQDAVDVLQAKLLGMPVLSKGGQQLQATMQNASAGLDQLARDVTDSSKNLDDIKKSAAKLTVGFAEDGKRLQSVATAQIMAGTASASMVKSQEAMNNATRRGIKNVDDQIKFEKSLAKTKTDTQEKSQATEAAMTQKAIQDMSKELNKTIKEVADKILPSVNGIVQTMGEFKGAVVAAVAVLLAFKAGGAFLSARKGASSIAETITGGGTGGGGTGGGAAGKAMGGLADGIGKLGPAMKSLGSGAGGMLSGFLKGVAGGLRAFASPMVAAGALGFGAAIAAIGAGFAAATWLTGKALPTFTEGMQSLQALDEKKLKAVGLGMAGVASGVIDFMPFGAGGQLAGPAVASLATGLLKLQNVDTAKIERVASAMQKVKDATPSLSESVSQGLSGLFGSIFGSDEEEAPAAATSTTAGTTGNENLLLEVQRLNSVSKEILTYIKQSADYAKQNVDATKALNGDLF